jgi:hypothetical protein
MAWGVAADGSEYRKWPLAVKGYSDHPLMEQAIAEVNYEMVIEMRPIKKAMRPAMLIPMVSMCPPFSQARSQRIRML